MSLIQTSLNPAAMLRAALYWNCRCSCMILISCIVWVGLLSNLTVLQSTPQWMKSREFPHCTKWAWGFYHVLVHGMDSVKRFLSLVGYAPSSYCHRKHICPLIIPVLLLTICHLQKGCSNNRHEVYSFQLVKGKQQFQ